MAAGEDEEEPEEPTLAAQDIPAFREALRAHKSAAGLLPAGRGAPPPEPKPPPSPSAPDTEVDLPDDSVTMQAPHAADSEPDSGTLLTTRREVLPEAHAATKKSAALVVPASIPILTLPEDHPDPVSTEPIVRIRMPGAPDPFAEDTAATTRALVAPRPATPRGQEEEDSVVTAQGPIEAPMDEDLITTQGPIAIPPEFKEAGDDSEPASVTVQTPKLLKEMAAAGPMGIAAAKPPVTAPPQAAMPRPQPARHPASPPRPQSTRPPAPASAPPSAPRPPSARPPAPPSASPPASSPAPPSAHPPASAHLPVGPPAAFALSPSPALGNRANSELFNVGPSPEEAHLFAPPMAWPQSGPYDEPSLSQELLVSKDRYVLLVVVVALVCAFIPFALFLYLRSRAPDETWAPEPRTAARTVQTNAPGVVTGKNRPPPTPPTPQTTPKRK